MDKCPYKKLEEIIVRDKEILEKLNGGSKKIRVTKKGEEIVQFNNFIN